MIARNVKKKRFVRFIDTNTGTYLPEKYGRCDRESNCSYYFNPYSDGYAKMIWDQEKGIRSELSSNWKPKKKKEISQPLVEPTFYDLKIFKETLQPERYEKNTFIQNLFSRFEVDDVINVIKLYRLGTAPNGATCFPFIDIKGNVCAIQEKQFDHTNSTDKNKKHHTSWTHTRLQYTEYFNMQLPEWLEAYIKNDKKVSCLFGEHLLSKYPSNPVALVEAPKTAIYCWLYFYKSNIPIFKDCIWLAVGAKGWLNESKVKVLKGRFVYVFPDLSKDGSTFKEWEAKAKEYESHLPRTRFIFSDLLEQLAPERDKIAGNDIADYLIKQDWRLFRKRNIQEQPPQPEPEKVSGVTTPENYVFSDIKPLPKTEFKEHEKESKVSIQEAAELFAWLNTEGKLIIPNPMTNKYVSVYPSVRHYNERLCLPDVVDQSFFQVNELNRVQIDLNLLTINH